jgi:hypothetical protein
MPVDSVTDDSAGTEPYGAAQIAQAILKFSIFKSSPRVSFSTPGCIPRTNLLEQFGGYGHISAPHPFQFRQHPFRAVIEQRDIRQRGHAEPRGPVAKIVGNRHDRTSSNDHVVRFPRKKIAVALKPIGIGDHIVVRKHQKFTSCEPDRSVFCLA